MDPYDSVVGGRLKLKKKIRKSTKSEPKSEGGTSIQRTSASGRIVSAGNTIQGHPQTHAEEEQQITYIMSQRSMNIANPFSSDIITTTNFYLGKPIVSTPGEKVINKTKVKMRQKSGIWSYKFVTKEVTRPLTAEERLDERTKLGRDKYCW